MNDNDDLSVAEIVSQICELKSLKAVMATYEIKSADDLNEKMQDYADWRTSGIFHGYRTPAELRTALDEFTRIQDEEQ